MSVAAIMLSDVMPLRDGGAYQEDSNVLYASGASTRTLVAISEHFHTIERESSGLN